MCTDRSRESGGDAEGCGANAVVVLAQPGDWCQNRVQFQRQGVHDLARVLHSSYEAEAARSVSFGGFHFHWRWMYDEVRHRQMTQGIQMHALPVLTPRLTDPGGRDSLCRPGKLPPPRSRLAGPAAAAVDFLWQACALTRVLIASSAGSRLQLGC